MCREQKTVRTLKHATENVFLNHASALKTCSESESTTPFVTDRLSLVSCED